MLRVYSGGNLTLFAAFCFLVVASISFTVCFLFWGSIRRVSDSVGFWFAHAHIGTDDCLPLEVMDAHRVPGSALFAVLTRDNEKSWPNVRYGKKKGGNHLECSIFANAKLS